AANLADTVPKFPNADARTVFIGHSDGGSVGLQALSLLGDPSRIELVTLSTPFLRTEPCVSRRALLAWQTAWFAITAAFLIALLGKHPLSLAIDSIANLTLWLYPAFLVFFLAVFLMTRAANQFEERIMRWQTVRFRGARVQCIRGVAEETPVGLAAGLISAGIGRLAGSILGRPASRLGEFARVAGILIGGAAIA